MNLRIIFIVFVSTLSVTAHATNYFARLTTGGYISTERFTDPLDGSTSNDFVTASFRAYVRAYDIGSRPLELIVDLRDKHDFFDKLDAERLQLTAGNTFTLNQVALKSGNEHTAFYGTLGRFPIAEAGAVNADGLEVGRNWSPTVRTSIFGGLNPKRPDQSFMTFNRDSMVYGTYTLIQPKSDGWDQNLYFANALVAQTVQGHVDRFFLFSNSIYQWNQDRRAVAMIYLDFVPRVYIQTAVLSYLHPFSPAFSGQLTGTLIDVIEYSRRQGVLSTLTPSPYQEAALSFRQTLSKVTSLDERLSYGYRSYDSRVRAEFTMGPGFSRLFNDSFFGKFLVGVGRNFNANQAFARLSLGYVSKAWEFGLDQDYGVQLETPAGPVYHPRVTEFSAARFLSKALYATLSIQNAQNERVNIWSSFLKIGYRVGSQDVAPLRDGAPPQGAL